MKALKVAGWIALGVVVLVAIAGFVAYQTYCGGAHNVVC